MNTNHFIRILFFYFLIGELSAQVYEMPKNPEERQTVKIESELKKSLKSGDTLAFGQLIQLTTGNFFADQKDYKTALKFLEDLEQPTDSLAFQRFKILIGGGYGTKVKLQEAQAVFNDSRFKNWVLSYPHKADLPLIEFFDYYRRSQALDAEAQIVLARYFLEYRISYPIGYNLLKTNRLPDAQYLAKKWELAKEQNQVEPSKIEYSLEQIAPQAENGSSMAKLAYGHAHIQKSGKIDLAKKYLLDLEADSLLAPKALAVRTQLPYDRDRLLALKKFYEQHQQSDWGKRYAQQISDWREMDLQLRSLEGFLNVNRKYNLGFAETKMEAKSLGDLLEACKAFQRPENEYLSPYKATYQERINQKYYLNLQNTGDWDHLLSEHKNLKDTTAGIFLNNWKQKDSLLIIQKLSDWVASQKTLPELKKTAEVFEKNEVALVVAFTENIENQLSSISKPYDLFQIKHDPNTKPFVQKIFPQADTLIRNYLRGFSMNKKDSLFFEFHAEIQFKPFQNIDQIRILHDTIQLAELETVQKDSLKRYLIHTGLKAIYSPTPMEVQVEELKNKVSAEGEWIRTIAQEVIFEFTNRNPNWFQGHYEFGGKDHFYEVRLSSEDKHYKVNIKRKEAEGYVTVYDHSWIPTESSDMLQIQIAYYAISPENNTKRIFKDDYWLVKAHGLIIESLAEGNMAEFTKEKVPLVIPNYDFQSLIRAVIEQMISLYPKILER
jgi:hypothetical protein